MLGSGLSQSADEREIDSADSGSAVSLTDPVVGSPAPEAGRSGRFARIVRGRTVRLLATAVAVVLAFLSRQALARGTPGFPPYVTFFPVIVLAALVGDVWVGIFATVLSALLVSYWVLAIGQFPISEPSAVAGVAIFVFTGVFVSVVTELYHRNREKLALYQLEAAVLSERNREDEARKAAEATLGSIGDAVMATDREGRITFLNPVAAELTGWNADDARTQPVHAVFKVIDEQTGARLEDILPRVLKDGLVLKAANHATLKTRDGREVAIENSAAPIFDEAGAIIGVVVVFRDVAQKRKAQAEQAEMAALLDLAHDSIVVLDLEWKIRFWNRGAEEMYGYSRQKAIGEQLFDLLRTSFSMPLAEIEADLLQGGHWNGELSHTACDGKPIVVASRWALQRGRNRQASRVMAISSNITERKLAEAALRESESAFATLANLVPQLVWMCTSDGSNSYYNQRWIEYTGLSPEESSGTDWTIPFHPEEKQASWAAWIHAMQTGEQYRVESRLRRADGIYRWFLIRGEPLRNVAGTVVRWFGTCTDIEDQKQAEQQLRALTTRLQRVREEERTKVARDLHDQIGQLLTAMKMDIVWIANRMSAEQAEIRTRLSGTVELISEGVRSVRKICSGLRPGVLDDLGLAAAIEWQANEFSSRTGIGCELSLPAAEVKVNGDEATAIFRIFQESLTNVARHAEARMVNASMYEEEQHLLLVVGDDGRGFDESQRTGSLGLLGMKERAQACGGDLRISSHPGSGTTVTVRVPLHQTCVDREENAYSDSR